MTLPTPQAPCAAGCGVHNCRAQTHSCVLSTCVWIECHGGQRKPSVRETSEAVVPHNGCCILQPATLTAPDPTHIGSSVSFFKGGDSLQSRCEAMQECGQHGFQLQSPTDPAHRGSQVCLGHKGGYPIMQVMPQPLLHFAKTVRASGNVQLQAHGMYSIARMTCRSQCVYLFSWPLQPGWQAVPD